MMTVWMSMACGPAAMMTPAPSTPGRDASVAGPRCGNDVAEGAEVCDGADVRGATCGPLEVGMVRCSASCDGFDVTGCQLATDGGPGRDAGSPPPDASVRDAGTDAGATLDAGATWSMALRVSGTRLVHLDGGPVDIRGAVSCCGGAYGWPLFDEPWLDLTSANGATFLHLRVGPFMTTTMNGETDLAPYGGGYAEDAGKADVDTFNPRFWARLRELLGLARARGQYVEVDVIDGWAIKHCRWGDIPGYSAWERASNTRDVDLCATAGSTAITPGSVADRWVRKVVQETGTFDNVLYQDGNEVSLIAGYDPAWSTSMRDIVRDEERRLGLAPHLFGTNSDDATTKQAVDFVELHQNQPATAAQCAGKPCLVNEYNPNPPLTAAQFHQRFCAARAQGTSFWYWRHGQSEMAMRQSLALMAQGCP